MFIFNEASYPDICEKYDVKMGTCTVAYIPPKPHKELAHGKLYPSLSYWLVPTTAE